MSAPLLAATAAALLATGCAPKTEMQRCVDENDRVVEDSFCAGLPAESSSQQYQNGTGPGTVHHTPVYHYYYGGRGAYTPGTLAEGGTMSPAEGHSYITSRGVRTGTARGGFGRWLSFHGTGHGGGE